MFAHSADSDAESDEMGVLDPVTIAQIVAEEEETANDLSRRLCSILLLGAPDLLWGDPDDDFDPMDYFVVPEDGGGRRQGGRGTARGPLEVARRPYQEASEDGSREEKRQRDFHNGKCQDAVHNGGYDNAPASERANMVGKEGYPTLAWNVNVGHQKLIFSVHGPFAGGRNDKTIVRADPFISEALPPAGSAL
eukprot:jgi/Tetstr1/422520/TSEL_001281.t1